MASEHAYGATLKNNKSESEAISFMLGENPSLRRPSREERKSILASLGLPASFYKTFDLVLVPSPDVIDMLAVPAEQLILIELKTTKKKLLNIPDKFFFGATENEFKLAEKLEDKFKFCFVSLHPDSRKYVFLTASELEKLIKTKRLQYQINL